MHERIRWTISLKSTQLLRAITKNHAPDWQFQSCTNSTTWEYKTSQNAHTNSKQTFQETYMYTFQGNTALSKFVWVFVWSKKAAVCTMDHITTSICWSNPMRIKQTMVHQTSVDMQGHVHESSVRVLSGRQSWCHLWWTALFRRVQVEQNKLQGCQDDSNYVGQLKK